MGVSLFSWVTSGRMRGNSFIGTRGVLDSVFGFSFLTERFVKLVSVTIPGSVKKNLWIWWLRTWFNGEHACGCWVDSWT